MKLLTLIFVFLSFSCSTQSYEDQFLNHLKSLCGKTFNGTVVSPLKENDPFTGKELRFTVAICSDTELRMPFQVGEDKSRTWILTKTDKGLLFKHDHRHEDGSPDSISNYGGLANRTKSTQFSQSFPADAFTAQLIPAASTNEWTIKLDLTTNKLDYILTRDNKLRFHASFDLTTNQ